MIQRLIRGGGKGEGGAGGRWRYGVDDFEILVRGEERVVYAC